MKKMVLKIFSSFHLYCKIVGFFDKLYSNEDMKRLIGVDLSQLNFLFEVLQKQGFKQHEAYCIPPKDRLSLVLLKLRQNPTNNFLSFITGIGETTIERYIEEIVNLLYEVIYFFELTCFKLKKLNIF